MQTEILAGTAYRYLTLSGGCGVIAVFIGSSLNILGSKR